MTFPCRVSHHQSDVLASIEHGAVTVCLKLAVFGRQPAVGLDGCAGAGVSRGQAGEWLHFLSFTIFEQTHPAAPNTAG